MGITKADNLACKERDQYTCQACGFGGSKHYEHFLQIDHIIPRAHGGEDSLHNYQTLCSFCNKVKSSSNVDFGGTMTPQKPQIWAENQRLLRICIGGASKKDMSIQEFDRAVGEFLSRQIQE